MWEGRFSSPMGSSGPARCSNGSRDSGWDLEDEYQLAGLTAGSRSDSGPGSSKKPPGAGRRRTASITGLSPELAGHCLGQRLVRRWAAVSNAVPSKTPGYNTVAFLSGVFWKGLPSVGF